MRDRTAAFAALVGGGSGSDDDNAAPLGDEAGTAGASTAHTKEALRLAENIATFHAFLLDNMDAYVDIGRYLEDADERAAGEAMTDAERDAIDAEAMTFARTCDRGIEALAALESGVRGASDGAGAPPPGSRRAHEKGVAALLMRRLREVTSIVQTQREERCRQATLLASASAELVAAEAAEEDGVFEYFRDVVDTGVAGSPDAVARSMEGESTSQQRKQLAAAREAGAAGGGGGVGGSADSTFGVQGQLAQPAPAATEAREQKQGQDQEQQRRRRRQQEEEEEAAAALFSAEERQLLEAEHSALAEKLAGDLADVVDVQKLLAEVAELMSVFADKVTEQHGVVEHIHDAAVSSTENMGSAVQELGETMKHGESSRVNIIAFFAIACLSLLFLDWFQP